MHPRSLHTCTSLPRIQSRVQFAGQIQPWQVLLVQQVSCIILTICNSDLTDFYCLNEKQSDLQSPVGKSEFRFSLRVCHNLSYIINIIIHYYILFSSCKYVHVGAAVKAAFWDLSVLTHIQVSGYNIISHSLPHTFSLWGSSVTEGKVTGAIAPSTASVCVCAREPWAPTILSEKLQQACPKVQGEKQE